MSRPVDEEDEPAKNVGGGGIPPGDFDELYAAGAAAIFPPGTVIADAAIGLLKKLAERLGYTDL